MWKTHISLTKVPILVYVRYFFSGSAAVHVNTIIYDLSHCMWGFEFELLISPVPPIFVVSKGDLRDGFLMRPFKPRSRDIAGNDTTKILPCSKAEHFAAIYGIKTQWRSCLYTSEIISNGMKSKNNRSI